MEEEKLERSIRKSEIPGLTREEEEAQLAKRDRDCRAESGAGEAQISGRPMRIWRI